MRPTLAQAAARVILAPGLVIAIATLVKGYTEVGDGFTAGVIAALTILIYAAAFGFSTLERRSPLLRLLPAAGFVGLALALAVALIPVARGKAILEHVPAPGSEPVKLGTLELVTAVAFDVGVFLLVLGAVVGLARIFDRGKARREP